MNETFVVASSFNCSLLRNKFNPLGHHFSAVWNQTTFGCKILNVLQDIFLFNVDYVIDNETFELSASSFGDNKTIDIYTRTMSLRSHIPRLVYPLHHMYNWNFGFTIYNLENYVESEEFYSKPFSTAVWFYLVIMAIFCTVLFYFFKRWEMSLVAGPHWESSFGYEILMVVGAYCQHIPPIDAILYSRRGAYFIFFIYAYLIYTYYTSNLLSHLVNDKDRDIDADSIFDSALEFVIVEDIKILVKKYLDPLQNGNNLTEHGKKVLHMKTVTTLEGLKAVKTGKTALLSEYQLLEPWKHSVFENHEICGLINVDLLTNLKKYFFVSNKFPYKEQFKTSLQRMEETGILQRMRKSYNTLTECVPLAHVQTHFDQILPPLLTLLFVYFMSVCIMIGEIVHSRIYKLWPYLD